MKKAALVLFVLFFAFSLSAQIRWTGTWGGTNGENGSDIILDGSNLLICGSQKNADTVEDDALLLNLSQQGTEQWVRRTQVNLWDRAHAVIPVNGGGFAYAGYCGAQSSTWDYILGKTDSEGNNLWVHSFGVGNKHERAYSLAQMQNGGFVVVGNNDTDYQGWLVITNADGVQTSTQTFSYTTETYAYDIVKTPMDHLLVVGTQKSGSNADVMLVMLNVAGTEIWHQNIGGTPSHYAFCGNNATDGFIIGGYHKVSGLEFNLMLMKTNDAGEMVWVQTYDVDDYEQINEVIQTPDGGFLAVGSTGNYTTKDWIILKTDASGTEEWRQRIGGTANDECNAIVALTDGNFTAVGATESYGSGGYDIWVVTFTPAGTITDEQILPSAPATALSGYPNPFHSGCRIVLKNGQSGLYQGAIYNLKGEKVRAFKINSTDEFLWDGTDDNKQQVSSGLYFVSACNGAHRVHTKIVLNR